MKVVQLSSSDLIGGASVACRRLHLALRARGVDSTLGVKISRESCPGIVTIGGRNRWCGGWHDWRRRVAMARYAQTRPWGQEMFSNPTSTRLFSTRDLPNADVVHLHWVTDFLDWRYFFRRIDRPWVWTLHDMNTFTGGCHYGGGCDRFSSGCGTCPQLGSLRGRDLSRRNWQVKRNALRRSGLPAGIIVAPSQWLAQQARRSPILEHHPITTVPNGIDETRWSPVDARTVRGRLGLPLDRTTILFASEVVGSKRKGFLELLAALAQLPAGLDCQLISIGQGSELGHLPVPHRHFGAIREEVRLAEIYNAADLFVIPSLEDNLPNTVIEAMACGTPVLGYAAGGIPEMVREGETGRIVPVGDHVRLAGAMLELIRNPARLQTMGAASRARVLGNYTVAAQAAAMSRLYESLLHPAVVHGPAVP